MWNQFINSLLKPSTSGNISPNPVPVQLPVMVTPTAETAASVTGGMRNPFMVAMNTSSQEFMKTYQRNNPFSKAVFLGYKDGKALYGASRLFILT